MVKRLWKKWGRKFLITTAVLTVGAALFVLCFDQFGPRSKDPVSTKGTPAPTVVAPTPIETSAPPIAVGSPTRSTGAGSAVPNPLQAAAEMVAVNAAAVAQNQLTRAFYSPDQQVWQSTIDTYVAPAGRAVMLNLYENATGVSQQLIRRSAGLPNGYDLTKLNSTTQTLAYRVLSFEANRIDLGLFTVEKLNDTVHQQTLTNYSIRGVTLELVDGTWMVLTYDKTDPPQPQPISYGELIRSDFAGYLTGYKEYQQ